MAKNLFQKVWDAHAVRVLANGQTQLLIGTHLIHEVTSPQAFGMLRDLGIKVKYPERTFATVDHIVPTDQREQPFSDPLADAMIKELAKNAEEFGVTYFDLSTGKQGIVHVVGPEQGITQPGTTIACGDSHTATHGAFGAIAFGIGTTQVRDVLATQTIALGKLKVRRINVGYPSIGLPTHETAVTNTTMCTLPMRKRQMSSSGPDFSLNVESLRHRS